MKICFFELVLTLKKLSGANLNWSDLHTSSYGRTAGVCFEIYHDDSIRIKDGEARALCYKTKVAFDLPYSGIRISGIATKFIFLKKFGRPILQTIADT